MKIKPDTGTNINYEQHAELPPYLTERKKNKLTFGPVRANFRRAKIRWKALLDKTV